MIPSGKIESSLELDMPACVELVVLTGQNLVQAGTTSLARRNPQPYDLIARIVARAKIGDDLRLCAGVGRKTVKIALGIRAFKILAKDGSPRRVCAFVGDP